MNDIFAWKTQKIGIIKCVDDLNPHTKKRKMNETKLKDKPKKLCKGDDTPHQKKLKTLIERFENKRIEDEGTSSNRATEEEKILQNDCSTVVKVSVTYNCS